VLQSALTRPPTTAEKGKKNVGEASTKGIIAPPRAITTVPDDIDLDDDPDVIELEDEIFDRYLAITQARTTSKPNGLGTAKKVIAPTPPVPTPPAPTQPTQPRRNPTVAPHTVRFATPVVATTSLPASAPAPVPTLIYPPSTGYTEA
jgi:hypothetical protein